MSGIPWAPNETLYNLGIILVELYLGESIQQVVLASREVGNEVGPEYQEVVLSCNHCNLDLTQDRMGFHDADFQQNALDKVIRSIVC